MRQINLSSQGQERSIDFGLLSTDAAMAVLAMKPVEEFVQGASSLSVTAGSSHAALTLDGPFLFADSALHSDAESRVVNKGKFAYRSTDSIHEKAKVVLLNAADNTPIQDAQGKELVAFLRVDVSASTVRLEFHVDNGDGTYSAAVVPAGVTGVLYQFLQRFSFDEIRPEVASTKKFFHGVVDVAVDNDLNQLLKDVYGPTGAFNGIGQAALGAGQSVVERLDDLVVDLAAETADRQSEDALLQSAITAEETRAMAEEADIRADFAAADSALEASLESLIDTEEARALAAESALSGAIQALSGSSGSSLSTLQAELDAEEARAIAEEADIRADFAAADASLQNILQTNIDAEETRALAAEAALQSDINAEETRALAAEAALQTAVDAEETRALAAEVALSGEITNLGFDLSSEVARALLSESSLQAAIDAEETRAMAEEADIRSDFAAADAATLSSAEDYTDQKIADLVNGAPALLDTLKEIADQLAADESVAAALANTVAANLVEAKAYTDTEVAAEETRALAAEAALQAEIDAEEVRALAAETALSGAIQALSGNSGSSLAALQAELDAEEARALAAEAALDAAKFNKAGGAIDANGSVTLSNDDAVASVSGSEISIVADHTQYDDFAIVSATQDLAGFKYSYTEDGALGVSKESSLGEDGVHLSNNTPNQINGSVSLDGVSINSNIVSSQANRQSSLNISYGGFGLQVGSSSEFEQELQFKELGLTLTNPNTGMAIMPTQDSNLVTKKYVDESDASLGNQLQDSIDAEETRALAAEAALQSDIDAEETRAMAEEADIRVDFAAADAALQAELDAEEARAMAEEADIRVDFAAADAALQSELDAEEARALAAEGVLQANIDSEASARVSGDNTLQASINSVLSQLNSFKTLIGNPVDMEPVTFAADGSYVLQQAPSGLVAGSKPMLAINGVLQESVGASPDFSIVADGTGVVRKVQLILGNKTVTQILGPSGTAVIWYRAVM